MSWYGVYRDFSWENIYALVLSEYFVRLTLISMHDDLANELGLSTCTFGTHRFPLTRLKRNGLDVKDFFQNTLDVNVSQPKNFFLEVIAFRIFWNLYKFEIEGKRNWCAVVWKHNFYEIFRWLFVKENWNILLLLYYHYYHYYYYY